MNQVTDNNRAELYDLEFPFYLLEDAGREEISIFGRLAVVLFAFAAVVVIFVSLRKPQYIPLIYPSLVFVVFAGYLLQGVIVSAGFLAFFTFLSFAGILVSASIVNKIVIFSSIMLGWSVFLVIMKYQNLAVALRGRCHEELESRESMVNDLRLKTEEIAKKTSACNQLITAYGRMVSFLRKSAANVFVGVEDFFNGLASSDYFGTDVRLYFAGGGHFADETFFEKTFDLASGAEFVVSPDSRRIAARFIPSGAVDETSDGCDSRRRRHHDALLAHSPSYIRYEWGIFEKKSGSFSDDDKRFISIAVDFARAAVSNVILYEKTQKLSIIDGLTGLFLRGYFMERFSEEFAFACANKLPLAVLIMDLDDFKKLNDTMGHSAGDEALRMVSRILKNRLRETDIVGRYGGEEFIVALPHTTMPDAISIAEELRIAIGREKFFTPGESGAENYFAGTGYANVTVSIGVASLLKDVDSAPEDTIARADQKLYEAKKSGKNRVA